MRSKQTTKKLERNEYYKKYRASPKGIEIQKRAEKKRRKKGARSIKSFYKSGKVAVKTNYLNEHYVYLYRSPIDGNPVYVGKGWGRRAWYHLEAAILHPEQHANKRFAYKIAKWISKGNEIEPEIVKTFKTHEKAIAAEKRLIKKYGRVDDKTGTLLNFTEGGEGNIGFGREIIVGGKTYPTVRAAALEYGLKPGTVHNRLGIHGYTIEQAFGLVSKPEYKSPNAKSISIKGVKYASIKAACKAYKLDYSTVGARLRRQKDWTIDQIFDLESKPFLHGPNASKIMVGDVTYPSIAHACRQLVPHLKTDTVMSRMKVKGWTTEQAFEFEPPPERELGVKNTVAVNGVKYRSIKAAAEDYGIDQTTVYWRLKHGWSLRKALSEPTKQEYVVGGRTYPNFSKACEHLGLNRVTVRERLKRGWSKERAFRLESKSTMGRAVTIDNVRYRSIRAACEAYGVKHGTVYSRIRKGWSIKRAVKTSVR